MAKKKYKRQMKDLPAGSHRRRKEYDRRGWAYDDTIDAKSNVFTGIKKKVKSSKFAKDVGTVVKGAKSKGKQFVKDVGKAGKEVTKNIREDVDKAGSKMRGILRPKKGMIRKPKKVVASEQTKGGQYPTYKKGSGPSKSFSRAFSEASKKGDATFMWDGRKYTTKKK
jgi:hypothetical protein